MKQTIKDLIKEFTLYPKRKKRIEKLFMID